jgi:hypothetical protein
MLTLPLEPTDDRAAPAFTTVPDGTRWLNQLQLTNIQLAHSKLLIQVNELNRFAMRASERLVLLEMLRETVEHVQNDYAKKLIAKPLLLSESEYMIFVSIVHLWQAMVTGYQRCLHDYLNGDKQVAQHGALLCQRCLLYSGLEIFEHLRTGYEFDLNLWHQLHSLFEFAESHNLHQTQVGDSLNTMQSFTNCCDIYLKTLLACDAHPAELTRSQLKLLDGWLTTWSAEIHLERYYSVSVGDAHPLAVDLSSTLGLQSATQLIDNEHIRYLALVPLSKLLRVKMILLEQGVNPEKIGLGNVSNAEECAELLNFLHKCWCESHSISLRGLRQVAQQEQVCYQPEEIFGQLAGTAFSQPYKTITAANREVVETFGSVSTASPKKYQAFTLENWILESDSLLGAQLLRQQMAGGRLAHTQLVALRPKDAPNFVLAAVTWLKVTRTGALQMGVRYLPGTPEPVFIHPFGLNESNELYQPAFLLPAVRELSIPSSLILPRQWFQPKRVLEMLTRKGVKVTLRVGISVEKGVDYERVSFEPVQI